MGKSGSPKIEIYTYSDPFQLSTINGNDGLWKRIKNCAYFCGSQTLVNGLDEYYRGELRYLTTVRFLVNALYSDWVSENTRVKQVMEVDNTIRALNFAVDDEKRKNNIRRSLEYNTKSIADCIRLFKELDLTAKDFHPSDANPNQKCLIEIYRAICEKETSAFAFQRVSEEGEIDQKIRDAINRVRIGSASERDYTYFKGDTVVFHGIYQFTPDILCAIRDLSTFKNVILLYNYQETYHEIYQPWKNIYEAFEKFKKGTDIQICHTGQIDCELKGGPSVYLADAIGRLANGGKENVVAALNDVKKAKELSKEKELEVFEFGTFTEFVRYCANGFEAVREKTGKRAGRANKKAQRVNVLAEMEEQIYSASGRENAVLRTYFPEQFEDRHFLDYPIGRFFDVVVNLWDNEKCCVRAGKLSEVKDCFASGFIKESAPGSLINTLNTVEPYIEGKTVLTDMIKALEELRKVVNPTEEAFQRIGYLNVGKRELEELIEGLKDLQEKVYRFFADFNDGGDNFDRFYKRIIQFLKENTKREEDAVVDQLLNRLEKINLPDTGTFACLKQTMRFFLSQEENLDRGSNWIVRDFVQIEGDILRSESPNQKNMKYHFCCLSDRDLCAAKDERLPWPLDLPFLEKSVNPNADSETNRHYEIFLTSKKEYKNFKRYALFCGLAYCRTEAGCVLSYVKTDDVRSGKDNELYHMLKLLGFKGKPYDKGNLYATGNLKKVGEGPGTAGNIKEPDAEDKIRWHICPYRYALESIIQEKPILRNRFLIINYVQELLKTRILDACSKEKDFKNRVKNVTIEEINKEYEKLNAKLKTLTECERTQIISTVKRYLARDLKSLKENENCRKFHEIFMVRPYEDLEEIIEEAMEEVKPDEIKNHTERYRTLRYKYCTYCSSKTVCVYGGVKIGNESEK